MREAAGWHGPCLVLGAMLPALGKHASLDQKNMLAASCKPPHIDLAFPPRPNPRTLESTNSDAENSRRAASRGCLAPAIIEPADRMPHPSGAADACCVGTWGSLSGCPCGTRLRLVKRRGGSGIPPCASILVERCSNRSTRIHDRECRATMTAWKAIPRLSRNPLCMFRTEPHG